MSKFKLEADFDFDFFLLGISSHAKDYRLCGAVNKKLDVDLQKEDDLILYKKNRSDGFSFYTFEDSELRQTYRVIANKSAVDLLIPEQKQADYFFILDGAKNNLDKQQLIQKFKEIDVVLTVFEIDPNGLKSKNNLIFD